MRFRVGPFRYAVKIVSALRDSDGRATDGVCVWSPRELRVSADVPPRQRVEVIMRLLREAWYYHFGISDDWETECQVGATFTVDAMRQLLAQGGEPALLRLTEGGAAEPSGVTGESTGAECAKCGGKVAGFHIATSETRLDEGTGLTVVDRHLDCDFCGHTQHWTESANQNGDPTGRVVGQLRFTKQGQHDRAAVCSDAGEREA